MYVWSSDKSRFAPAKLYFRVRYDITDTKINQAINWFSNEIPYHLLYMCKETLLWIVMLQLLIVFTIICKHLAGLKTQVGSYRYTRCVKDNTLITLQLSVGFYINISIAVINCVESKML